MTSRGRDFNKKYVSGAEKERKRKTRDEYIKTFDYISMDC